MGKKQLHLIEESFGVSLSADTQGRNLKGEYFERVIPSTLEFAISHGKNGSTMYFWAIWSTAVLPNKKGQGQISTGQTSDTPITYIAVTSYVNTAKVTPTEPVDGGQLLNVCS